MKWAGVVLAVVLVGAGGGGLYWRSTEGTRAAQALLRESLYVSPQVSAALMQHAGEPAVHAAARAWFLTLAEAPDLRAETPPQPMETLARVFAARPMEPDAQTVPAAARFAARLANTSVLTWVQGFDAHPGRKAAWLGALDALSLSTFSWARERSPKEAHAPLALNHSQLELQGLTAQDDAVLPAVVSAWIRFDDAAAAALLAPLGHDARVTKALEAHLLRWAQEGNYRHFDGELQRLTQQLGQRVAAPSDEVLLALFRFGKTPEAAALVRHWGHGAQARLKALQVQLPDDAWHRGQAAALLAHLGEGGSEQVGPLVDALTDRARLPLPRLDVRIPGSPLFESTDWGRKVTKAQVAQAVADLQALGAVATPTLLARYHGVSSAPQASVVAQALAGLDAPALARVVLADLPRYDALHAEAVKRLAAGKVEAKGFAVEDYVHTGRRIAQGLKALAGAAPAEAVTAAFLGALHSSDASLSGYALATLKQRAPAKVLVPLLFTAMGGRARYDEREVDTYVALMTSQPGGGPAITAALEALLKLAGAPQKVPLLQKVVGLRALENVGTASAVPLLERYAKDPSSYASVTSRVDRRTGRVLSESPVELRFADLAHRAAVAAQRRR